MTRIRPIDQYTADAGAAELLDTVKRKTGSVPNLIATMANSPAVAKAYLGFAQALSTGTLPPRLREQIALVVGETNNCGYCLAAHTALGKGAGLTEQETRHEPTTKVVGLRLYSPASLRDQRTPREAA